ncbi:MAG: RNA-binding protein [Flavobacteriales bacterium CG_4_9_14_3_um_filter_32_8]|nr:MAG: RNA-binding protein [Flavobacteriales bacterium CG_4_9_14_3_um_filter_32_8]
MKVFCFLMRLDKLIWALRLYKTRSLASKACNAEKVKLNGEFAKPSKVVVIGNEISVKVIPIWRTFKIIDLPKSRVNTKLLPQFIIETTASDDLLQLLQNQLVNNQNKILGIKGRPTKKIRRDLDELLEE